MTTEERIEKQKELVEKIGRYYEKEGFQPIAGRILGLLMIMDKEQFTFDEIVNELSISKSSASNALRNLEIRGDIEYITLPGDRKRYFQLKKKNVSSIFEEFEEKMTTAKDIFQYIIALKADKNSNNAKYMEDLSKIIEFLLKEIHAAKLQFNNPQ